MALPPIISNLPIFKFFRSEGPTQSQQQTQSTQSGGGTLPRDVVEVSDAALDKLNQSQDKIRNEAQARDTAEDVRDDLAENEDVSLGLDEDRLSA
ncbi:hypothetical protein [Micavibrio aeruginosavorus]|uniref:Uncharacterized protein n=1 Tax=Micavibrio aeruginosavorus EPB TaxID=349215 RepID=M4VWL5_9BACT|nr:hypothetical protein [Micavibrio aeruginosavorus]AGH97584.1 hypothetical protein A11S_761 [Micavibrio aeruginosavorus EPB]